MEKTIRLLKTKNEVELGSDVALASVFNNLIVFSILPV